MFDPEGGQEAEVGTRGQGSGINYRAKFTGIADVTPLRFNPTKQQIIEIKEIAQERQQYEQEPTYVGVFTNKDGAKSTKLTLLTKFNPHELLEAKGNKDAKTPRTLPDNTYVEIAFSISDRDEVSKSGKFRFINENLQSTWANSLDDLKGNNKMSWFVTETARVAKEGEVLLYNLVYAMSKLASTKEKPITKFKLGNNPTETFCDIVAGDVSILNDLLDSDTAAYKHFSHEDKTARKVAVMLGVKTSDKQDKEGNYYLNQVVFVNAHVSNCFAKEGRMLSKDAIDSINSDNFRASTQNSLKLQVFDAAAETQKTINALSDLSNTTVNMPDSLSDMSDYNEAFSNDEFFS